jgi:glutamine amidotransferase
MVHPIIDEYYNYNPYHKRSSKLIQDKGLVTNEKGSTPTTPGLVNGKPTKSKVSSSLHESLASTLVPAMRSAPSASPMLSPSQEHTPLSELRNVISNISASARDPTKPQELGNTKKKRKSLSSRTPPQTTQEEPEPDSPPQRASYGDPMKIAQYFPELT